MTDKNKNKMGLLSIILLGFNSIIGSGIFLLPNKVMAQVGPAALLVTVFDAILVISIAMCFAEAGGMFKKNGGPYVYAKEAFGEFVGFEVGFMKWAIAIIAWATMTVGFAEALMGLLPKGTFSNPNIAKAIIVTIIVVLLTGLNLSGLFFLNIIIDKQVGTYCANLETTLIAAKIANDPISDPYNPNAKVIIPVIIIAM